MNNIPRTVQIISPNKEQSQLEKSKQIEDIVGKKRRKIPLLKPKKI